MSGFRFEFVDKSRKGAWLPRLFDILYANMNAVVPSGMTYEEEKARWLSAVGPALEKAPRQIILMYAGEMLAGYFQYYVNGGRFMVEEIQIAEEYQSTTLLYALFRYLGKVLPKDIETVAAYAHERNLHSRSVIYRLGMKPKGEPDAEGFCFYEGEFPPIAAKFQI